jgi:hypothetical protein
VGKEASRGMMVSTRELSKSTSQEAISSGPFRLSMTGVGSPSGRQNMEMVAR